MLNSILVNTRVASSTSAPVIRYLFVLYGCETWSVTLREEHKQQVFGNEVVRKIFVPKGADVTGDWKRLRCEDNHYWYSSANIIRVIESRTMRWAGRVARMGERRGVCMILVGKSAEKRPFGRP